MRAAVDLGDARRRSWGGFSNLWGLVQAGYSAGPGSTTGIISTVAQLAGDGTTILAMFDAGLAGVSQWHGATVSSTTIIGKYTYFGDATLDGQVTSDDYLVLDQNRNTSPATGLGWIEGDATSDGSVTPDDYLVLDTNRGLGVGDPL